VRGFSLAIPRGECFGILGPNGAGKTSSINMVFLTICFSLVDMLSSILNAFPLH
jgi:ABC-type lipopolysaccharide export system ATPase subunit